VSLVLFPLLCLSAHEFDAIHARDILSVASIEHRALVVTAGGSGRAPLFSLFFFDVPKRSASEIEDGRVGVDFSTRVFASYANEFMVFNKKAWSASILDSEARFLERMDLQRLTEITGSARAVAVFSVRETLFVSYRKFDDLAQLYLVSFDYRDNRATELHHREVESLSAFWVPWGSQWLFVDPDRAVVTLEDRMFREKRTLIHSRDAISMVPNQSMARTVLERGVSPYARLLDTPYLLSDREIVFAQREYTSEKMPRIRSVTALLIDSDGQVQEQPRFPLSDGQNETLYYVREDGTFHLSSSP